MRIGPQNQKPVLPRLPEIGDVTSSSNSPASSRKAESSAESSSGKAQERTDVLQLSGAEGTHRLVLYSRPRQESMAVADAGGPGGSHRINRLDQVRRRIESGFYDRSEVIEKIAERLAENLTESESSQGDWQDNYGIGND